MASRIAAASSNRVACPAADEMVGPAVAAQRGRAGCSTLAVASASAPRPGRRAELVVHHGELRLLARERAAS